MINGTATLALDNIHSGYGRSEVLDGINLEVGHRRIVGVAGANGVGKTTLLRTISGAVRRTAGSVHLDGKSLDGSPERVVRQGISHVPEGRQCFSELSVRENLRVASAGAGHKLAAADLELIESIFPPISQLMDRRAGLLSGGEQQMVAIGRGIVSHPKVLMIDELSLGLAPVIVRELWQSLHNLRATEGTALLVVDQNPIQLKRYCDELWILRRGKLVLEGGMTGTDMLVRNDAGEAL